MCECPCGDVHVYRSFEVAGNVISVERYPGCQECSDQISVVLHHFTPDGAGEFADTQRNPAVPWPVDDLGNPHVIPIVSVKAMMQAAKELSAEEEIDPAEYATFEDMIEQFGLRLLQRAMRITVKE